MQVHTLGGRAPLHCYTYKFQLASQAHAEDVRRCNDGFSIFVNKDSTGTRFTPRRSHETTAHSGGRRP